jgi:hypothetical protein
MRKVLSALLIGFTLFLGVSAMAKGKRYELPLGETIQANGVQVKSGTYDVELDGNTLVFYQGKKEVAKVDVRVEEQQTKNENTSVTVSGGKLVQVQLGGMKSKLVVAGSQ